MPKIRRQTLPPALLDHLLDRISSREISANQLGLFADWLDSEPEVPNDKWFKRFPDMIVCSKGELVKTFLTAQQIPVFMELPIAVGAAAIVNHKSTRATSDLVGSPCPGWPA
jgi:hypothetical protein